MPGLAALGALLFTWMQVGQANKELQISERGQITNRFNVAIGNLGSQSLDVRLGGIYSLQRIMQDSAGDQPTIILVLAAFAQRHSGSSLKSSKSPTADDPDDRIPPADVQAAISSLSMRNPKRDAGAIIDLSRADLRGLNITSTTSVKLPGASLGEADLRWAVMEGADLRGAFLFDANLESALLMKSNLKGAVLPGARLVSTYLADSDLRKANMTCAEGVTDEETGKTIEWSHCVDMQGAVLDGADLQNAMMSRADLRDASLKGADLRGADLSHADFRNADLTNADFRAAKMHDAKLQGAKRTGARGLPAQP